LRNTALEKLTVEKNFVKSSVLDVFMAPFMWNSI